MERRATLRILRTVSMVIVSFQTSRIPYQELFLFCSTDIHGQSNPFLSLPGSAVIIACTTILLAAIISAPASAKIHTTALAVPPQDHVIKAILFSRLIFQNNKTAFHLKSTMIYCTR
jgi:hypothetical protein